MKTDPRKAVEEFKAQGRWSSISDLVLEVFAEHEDAVLDVWEERGAEDDGFSLGDAVFLFLYRKLRGGGSPAHTTFGELAVGDRFLVGHGNPGEGPAWEVVAPSAEGERNGCVCVEEGHPMFGERFPGVEDTWPVTKLDRAGATLP